MNCCVFGDDGEAPSCFARRVRTARKAHYCWECEEQIVSGQRYEYTSGVWDGRPHVYKTCLSCVEIRDHFTRRCNSNADRDSDVRPIIGELWSALEEYFFPEMRAGGPCLDGLSPEAKGRMFERRTEWLIRGEIERNGAPPPRVQP